ncbi:MAG: hypothetical protein DRN68_01205 [Thaumarchaeota archaeon]|nr:MAG: hypothetical protein DRN68_01205 [Nitrososphaerota archaeon]
MITKIVMPKLDQAMEKGTIGEWLKKEGDRVEKGEPILRIDVDKASFELEAERSGYLRKILYGEGETVEVGKVIAYISDSMDEAIPEEEPITVEEAKPVKEVKKVEEVEVKASPLAKKLAREKGIDLSKVKGSGPGGRILAKDVLAYIESLEKPVEHKIIPLSKIRRITAERMSLSKRTIPHFYVQVDVDASELIKLRQSLIPEVEKLVGVKLAYDDLIMKATAIALREFPILNSTFEENSVKIFPSIDICLAISVDDELVAPVMREVDKKRISEIAKERAELVKRAREHRLEPKDVRGGSFTISNVGMFGVDWLAAIINPPQAAILSIGAIKDTPIVKDGRIEIKKVMKLVLSVDHRVADGAVGCRFLGRIKELLENPYILLKDGI